jgi:hypothetical protein
LTTKNTTHEARLTAVETNIDTLSREMGDVKDNLAALNTLMHRGFNEIKKDLSDRNKTAWNPIIAAIGVAVTIFSAIVVIGSQGPLNNIATLQSNQEAMRANRFTDKDGEALEAHFKQMYESAVSLSAERHAHQQELFDRQQARTDLNIAKIWDHINEVTDEDFKRPEADAQEARIMAEVRWIREMCIRNGNKSCAKE